MTACGSGSCPGAEGSSCRCACGGAYHGGARRGSVYNNIEMRGRMERDRSPPQTQPKAEVPEQPEISKAVSNFIEKPIEREIAHYTMIAILSAAAPPLAPVAELAYNALVYGKPAYTIVSKALEWSEGRGDKASNYESIARASTDLAMSKPADVAASYAANVVDAGLGIGNHQNALLNRLIFEPVASNAFSYGIDVLAKEAAKQTFPLIAA